MKVKNNDPFEHPIIDPNSLSHPQDLADMIKIRVLSIKLILNRVPNISSAETDGFCALEVLKVIF